MSGHGGRREPLTRADLEAAARVYLDQGRRVADAARVMGLSRAGLLARLKRACAEGLLTEADLHQPNLARPDSRRGRKMARSQAGAQPASVEKPGPEQGGKGGKPAGPGDAVTLEGDDTDTLRLVTLSPRIRTVDEALAKARVDPEAWEVERFVVNSWEVGCKIPKVGVAITPLWQVKVWLKRRAPLDPAAQALAGLCSRLEALDAPHPAPPAVPDLGPHLAEICLFDHHFGKLAWGRETGEDYDLDIAVDLHARAYAALLGRAAQFGVNQVVMPIGQDFLHVDNLANTTEKGTLQDVDTRLPKVFQAAFRAVLSAVDLGLAVAPVRLVWVPGNHDRTTSYFLCRELAAYYRNSPHVQVDVEPRPRKRLRWGRVLIGYTHGEDENHRDLPSILASEWPEDWAAADWREWHVGHWHKKKETVYTAGDTFNGCRVMVLPSLCGIDAWHYKKGYVKSGRAAVCNLYHPEHGPAGQLEFGLAEGFGRAA